MIKHDNLTRTGSFINWDRDYRKEKAQKILAVISDAIASDISSKTCLDIGCGCGTITDYMGHSFSLAVGVDIETELIQQSIFYAASGNVHFVLTDAMQPGFKDKTFDVIIANQIYEHVQDANRLMDEIYRLLKDDGICYFAAANKMRLIEPHWRLPLLHLLPKKLANAFLRAVGDSKIYNVELMDYWKLKRLVKRRFDLFDYTIPVLTKPERFHVEARMRKPLLERVPEFILTTMLCFSPSYIWILKKRL